MSEQNKIKVGVIGVGVLGRYHTNLYKQSPNAELVGVYDAAPAAAEKIAAEFETKAFSSIRELAEQCDALSVAVPATLHHQVAMELISMKKHILMEKPIAAEVSEAEEMVSAAEKEGLVFAVGHVERFNPAMDFLCKNSNPPMFLEVHRLAKYPPPRPGMHRRGTEVSVVLDLMIHDLDLVLSLVKSEVEKIEAFGAAVLSETEDIANVRLTFKNGTVANITASRISPDPMRKIRVFYQDSYASMDYGSHNGKVCRTSPLGVVSETVELDTKNALGEELEDFLSAVSAAKENGGTCIKQPKVSGLDGLNALKLAIRITEEIRAHQVKYQILKKS